METIASFAVDHTNLRPGIYISRKDNVGGEEVAFVICAFGGRVATDAIANGVDAFGGSLEGFVYFDAGGGVFAHRSV